MPNIYLFMPRCIKGPISHAIGFKPNTTCCSHASHDLVKISILVILGQTKEKKLVNGFHASFLLLPDQPITFFVMGSQRTFVGG